MQNIRRFEHLELSGQSCANTGRHTAFLVLKKHRFVQTLDEAACNCLQRVFPRQAFENDNKFVSSDTGNRIVIARFLKHDAGRLLQDEITCRMAQPVIHGFEEIKIQMHQSKSRICRDHMCQHVIHGPTVF